MITKQTATEIRETIRAAETAIRERPVNEAIKVAEAVHSYIKTKFDGVYLSDLSKEYDGVKITMQARIDVSGIDNPDYIKEPLLQYMQSIIEMTDLVDVTTQITTEQ